MTSRDRHARLRAEACHIRVSQGQVLQGCARDTSDRLRREMEHTGQRTRGARPSTELSGWTIDRVRRRLRLTVIQAGHSTLSRRSSRLHSVTAGKL